MDELSDTYYGDDYFIVKHWHLWNKSMVQCAKFLYNKVSYSEKKESPEETILQMISE